MESPPLFLYLEGLEERRKKLFLTFSYINQRSFLSNWIMQCNALTEIILMHQVWDIVLNVKKPQKTKLSPKILFPQYC